MKTGSISELSSLLAAGGIAPGVQSKAVPSASESFSQIMSQAGGSGAGDVKSEKDSIQASSSIESSSKGRSASTPNENGSRIKSAEAKPKDLDRNELGDELQQAADKITGELKEKLGVTDEELQEAMEVLGLSVMDLLDPQALQQLYTELSGAEDTMSLITDEELYSGLQEILEEVETLTGELKEKLGISDEEFKNAVAELKNNKPAAINDEKSAVKSSIETEASNETEESAPSIEIKDERTQKDSQQTEDGALFNQGGAQEQTEQVQETSQAETAAFAQRAQTEEITRQIVEQIRVRVTEATTSLEMELNPASLGRVGLAIESKNGVITASFTTTDEAVRAAIEGQMVQLQENLEKQGVKVEAVEVTVASHEFEENLEKGKDENEQANEESERLQRIAGRRRASINLLSEDEEEEEQELTEEEEINRDMMIRNGNSVDFQA